MKRLITFFCGMLCVAPVIADSWVDSWLSQRTTTSPGYFEGQKRGYFTAGGLQARWRMSTDNPVSVSMPRIRAGCGGVDLFMGGVSFLDPEFLVDKFQRIIQAAPALAFDMAMKEMCKECSESMSKLEAATNWLNNLQLNDCAISKRIVATTKSDDPDILGAVWNEVTGGVSLNEAMDKNWQAYQARAKANGGRPSADIRHAIDNCPADFLAIFTNGSVITNAATRLGLGPYEDIMRGYVGDVEVAWDDTAMNYQANPVDPCRENNLQDIVDFIDGSPRAKHNTANGGDCYQDSTTTMNTYINTQLTNIAQKILTNNAAGFSTEEQTFINNAPLPVLEIMKTSVIAGNVNEVASNMAEPLAIAYAYRMMDDLFNTIEYVMRKADSAANPTGVAVATGDGARCRPLALKNVTEKIITMRHELRTARGAIRNAYTAKVKELTTSLEYAQRELAHRERIEKTQFSNIRQ